MAELLLAHGYFLYEDPKELQILKPYAPLGILYLCSHLRKRRVRCRGVRHHLLQPGRALLIICAARNLRYWGSMRT